MIKEIRRKMLAPGLAALAAVIILIIQTLCCVWESTANQEFNFPETLAA